MTTYYAKSLTIYPDYLIALIGASGADWDISVASGTVQASNLILMDSNAIGGATFIADATCVDGGNNTGWIFMSSPSINTDAATSVLTTSGKANGEIVSTGGINATRRGFCYVEGSGSPAPTITDSVVYEDGSFSAGTYNLDIAGLTQGTIYAVRAYAIINTIVYYGATVLLTTYPDTPSNFALTAAEDSIALTWDSVAHADSYTVYWGAASGVTISSYSFLGALSPFIHASLTPLQIYYYRISATTNGLESNLSIELSSAVLSATTLPTFSPQNWLTMAEYLNLLTSEYQLAANFKQWLQDVLQKAEDGMTAANSLNNNFDLDFAVGTQLDILGEILGQGRTLTFQPADGTNPILEDDIYRKLLKAKVVLNHWDGQLYSIEQQWTNIFPGTQIIIIDNQDMTLSVSVTGEISTLIQEMIAHDMIMPRPQAVGVNYTWAVTIVKKFCFDMDTLEYGGFDEANWILN
jgi:hypothetical protein